jgi:hypothetical protein
MTIDIQTCLIRRALNTTKFSFPSMTVANVDVSSEARDQRPTGQPDQCRLFEVPAPQAANSLQELQIEKRH